MIVLQAFMDESGNWGSGSKDKYFVMAGFISTADRWQSFCDDWDRRALFIKMKMNVVMKEVEKSGKSTLTKITEMIEQSVLYRVECAVDLDSYRRCAQDRVPPNVDTPYFWAFINTIDRICRTALEMNYKGIIDLFFDVHFGIRYEKWYDLARRCYMRPEYVAILPASIHWVDDEKFLQLKSADLLAGLARRDLNVDVLGLETIVSRINLIPIVSDSYPLTDAYFNRVVASEPDILDSAEYLIWKKKWHQ